MADENENEGTTTEFVRPATLRYSEAPYMGQPGSTGNDTIAGEYFYGVGDNPENKYVKNKDLNSVIYSGKPGRPVDSAGNYNEEFTRLENIRNQIYEYYRNNDEGNALRKIDELVSNMNGGSTLYFRDPLKFVIDRESIRWSETVENNSGGDNGDSTTTIYYEGIAARSPAFSIEDINKLQGYTFENCYIGGPLPDAPSKRGSCGEYIKLRYMNLGGIRFINCKIAGDNVFEKAEINGATFRNCYIKGVDFTLCSNVHRNTVAETPEIAPEEADGYYPDEEEEIEVPTETFVSTRKDPLHREDGHNKRPYLHWYETLYEDIDPRDYTYNGEISYIDFSGTYFDNCIFDGRELIGLDLRNCIFKNCSFNNTHIHESKYGQTRIKNCSLNNSRFVNFNTTEKGELILENVSINSSIIAGCTINNYNFSSNGFYNSYIGQCVLNNCNFSNLDLYNTGIQNCILNNCNLRNTNLAGFSFIGTELNNCNLSNFRSDVYTFPLFKKCKLDGTSIISSNYAKHADFDHCEFSNLSLENIELTFSNFSSTKFNNVTVNNCKMNGVEANNSNIRNSNFINCELRGMKFTESVVNNTHFTNCDMRGSNFDRSSLTDNSFDNSDIRGVF